MASLDVHISNIKQRSTICLLIGACFLVLLFFALLYIIIVPIDSMLLVERIGGLIILIGALITCSFYFLQCANACELTLGYIALGNERKVASTMDKSHCLKVFVANLRHH
ncbi:hypothetical protein S2091_4266 [Solimicrobium silvestre]|uniref:Uncharacterized protein n=1 Tax=Solimicrobium silvestre TaxID=2099400 RepID=A0A2S9GTC7_9BURK|nr:hypothetical protein S2091_4266 [Solimicrobium silvestre]